MKCKVLVITHGKLAQAFIETAQLIMGDVEQMAYFNMPEEMDICKYKSDLEAIIDENSETGVLVITDLLGGSPFLVMSQVLKERWDKVELITGCNLPMLLQIGTQIEENDISCLKQIALEAAKEGVVDLKERFGNK